MESPAKIPILIVDDNPENLLVMEAVLRNPQYEIIQAKSGQEALEVISSSELAVILLDIQMPDMDGYEVARRVKDYFKIKRPPIIFVTAGMNDRSLIETGYEVGAVDYLFKPIEPLILKSKVSVFADLYRAQKEIAEQAELLRIHDQQERDTFLEKALDAVIGMNEDGNVIYWNEMAMLTFGWTKKEILGKHLSHFLIPKEFRQSHEKGLRHFLMTGEGPIFNKRIEVTAVKKNKEIIPVELAVVPIKSETGYTFSAFIRDISERKREQENLKHAIQARDEFISVCSHELKTPLTSMQLQFQLASKLYNENNPKILEKENVKKRLDLANKQLSRMNKLIENMLDVSRMSSGKLNMDHDRLNLVSLTVDLLQSFKEQFDDLNIKVDLVIKGSKEKFVMGDSFRLEQVISNLFTNAMKYGDGKPVTILLEDAGENVRLCVEDKGLGIETNNLERIFERYERAITASEISGLGLGLYISKQIVEAHHGTLNVRSEKGKGSVFSLELPKAGLESQVSH